MLEVGSFDEGVRCVVLQKHWMAWGVVCSRDPMVRQCMQALWRSDGEIALFYYLHGRIGFSSRIQIHPAAIAITFTVSIRVMPPSII